MVIRNVPAERNRGHFRKNHQHVPNLEREGTVWGHPSADICSSFKVLNTGGCSCFFTSFVPFTADLTLDFISQFQSIPLTISPSDGRTWFPSTDCEYSQCVSFFVTWPPWLTLKLTQNPWYQSAWITVVLLTTNYLNHQDTELKDVDMWEKITLNLRHVKGLGVQLQ